MTTIYGWHFLYEGHKLRDGTARYAHLAAGRLADAVATIGAKRSQPAPKKKAA